MHAFTLKNSFIHNEPVRKTLMGTGDRMLKQKYKFQEGIMPSYHPLERWK